ncbi:MAG TPA: class II aldolase/adducin family protein [Candidatus Angelobacter sp.]|jgi:L-fuculose-phosphate aldolase
MDIAQENSIRRDICRIGTMLHERGFVAACDGNISVRLGQDLVLCSPTSICKGMMEPEDLVLVDMQGSHKQGKRRASTELGMHLLFYLLRPHIRAVVHAHPPTATGFAAAGISLEEPLVAEVVVACGKIPLAHYGTPGSLELSESLRPLIPTHDALLMANHGAVTCGHDLMQAYMKMETVEHYARIALVARQLGPTRPLPAAEITKLMRARDHYEANKPPQIAEWEQ